MAGPFTDWARRGSVAGPNDGVGILRWYAVEVTPRKGESVSNRRGWEVCGGGIGAAGRFGVGRVDRGLGPAYVGVTGGMERLGDIPAWG